MDQRSDTARVMAIVLTYDAPEALARCLPALAAQHASLAEVLVVDNASDPPAADTVERVCGARVLRLAENIGPAGGYAAGLRAFLESDCAWAWVMDDDCVPRADALAVQLGEASGDRRLGALLATMIDETTGEVVNTHGWCGVLLPREVVAAVGVPNEALFWWTEDTEYLQWRIPRAGFETRRCERALVGVSRARPGRDKPAWKYYYEARNQVYHRVHVTRPGAERPVPRYLTVRVRARRAARSVAMLAAGAVWRERRGRARKLAMVARGTVDGLRGHLGRTVPADRPDRPAVGKPAS